VFVAKPRAVVGGRQSAQKTLLVGEVLLDFAVPGLNELRDGFAAVGGRFGGAASRCWACTRPT
jgi:hypothetical protein